MNNKEVMDRLQAYYITQDPATIARALASLMVDLNRLSVIDRLPAKERECLEIRLNMMMDELQDFVKNGPKHELRLIKMNSEEEE